MKENGAKERILNAAGELFYEQGYLATGINQIIEEAGIAKASLYQHFPSKDALLTAYLHRTRLHNHELRTQFLNKLAPGKDKLMGLYEYRLQHMQSNHFKGCAFIRIAYELPGLSDEAMAQIRTHSQTIRTFITEQLLVIRKNFPENELEEMADMLLNLYEGAGLQGYILKSPKPMEDTKKVVARLLDTL
ncbi:MAG: TetR/AcrR family transcriptional regulator [Chitinophaga sp.]|uniref:TetR/AcrR family transcriptional regulator n=1 Tax=Chitinophaga sp. TaxID=1869181 RepID=UPI001B23698A|nr:TetR/AcrR family transcriptional regulator [Chitinophaga sp.]MBO9732217.1 TetR/AcrR family transcriptional regulator [Chitinophaga sp.]